MLRKQRLRVQLVFKSGPFVAASVAGKVSRCLVISMSSECTFDQQMCGSNIEKSTQTSVGRISPTAQATAEPCA
ncbi:uncharacterized protein YALI1_C18878g [Yarrowia lipolytica]|uniref:Uncharacterized protein n=1 Tax=Yarrowia lipolytica TaxID=4952 RepID=A0A1D8NB08_YARLL|nr:hypothetical protein YALI1_C18878g [Yarrowia lipolytica]